MDAVFAGITWKYMLVFVDDVCVYTKTFEEHLESLGQVFARARAGGVHFSPKKCHFAKKEVEFLGFVVTTEGLKPQSPVRSA